MHTFEVESDVVDIPLMCLCFKKPADGLPIFHSWLMTAKDILFRGYEGWREIPEVRAESDAKVPGETVGFASVVPVKGLGRMSIILWSLLWAYLHKDPMDAETKDDFRRRL
jgi:hypothetical protein